MSSFPLSLVLLTVRYNHLGSFYKIQMPGDSNHIETPPFFFFFFNILLTPELPLALPFPLTPVYFQLPVLPFLPVCPRYSSNLTCQKLKPLHFFPEPAPSAVFSL